MVKTTNKTLNNDILTIEPDVWKTLINIKHI